MSATITAVESEQPVPPTTQLDWQPGNFIGERANFEFSSSDRRADKSHVAALSKDQIDGMEPEDLARVVAAASMPFSQLHGESRLKMLDRPTLRRLAYLARRTCRNQGY